MRGAGSETQLARRVVIEGRVQGVGFRQACAAAARGLGVAGWVRNRRDGRVEAHFEGEAAAVGQAVAWCWSGPALTTVTGVRVREAVPVGATGFRVAATE